MDFFTAVRLYAGLESCVFTALLIVWLGELSDDAKLVLGWIHGVGWLFLCASVFAGCVRRVFPWPVLAATVSPLGPIGALVGIELAARQRRVA